MLVKIINSNTAAAMTELIDSCARAAELGVPGTDVVAVNPAMGPASIESHYDEALSMPLAPLFGYVRVLVRIPMAVVASKLLVGHREQSTATSRAVQMARIRVSASRPSRSTNTPTETLSTESRFTAERRGIGSDPGSRTTSLASPRMVVVHGATSARLSRGIAASRESTTTGRRPISAISHHQTSPRAGSALTSL